MSEPQKLTISVNDDQTTAYVYSADKKNRSAITVVLGHGAGGNQLSGFMQLFANGLAQRGMDVVTFNFLYMEKGRGAPDPKGKLESCYRSVIETARAQKKLKSNRLVIGGKSMGGRIASQVAAAAAAEGDPLAQAISGLVFLGYPLHPPGNPAKLRAEHLQSIRAPMLFVQGTRDSLGTPEEIQPIIKQLRLPARIYIIESGDHSFKAPKKFGLTQDEVYESAMNEIDNWSRSLS
jgi:predicted alpha/beta-hydrolase family hydrolase